MTPKDKPAADRIGADEVEPGLAPRTPASTIRRPRSAMPATRTAWSRKESRQLVVVVMRPPMSGPAAARAPRGADGAERLGAGGHVTEEDRREDVDRGISSAVPMPCRSE